MNDINRLGRSSELSAYTNRKSKYNVTRCLLKRAIDDHPRPTEGDSEV
jgi:hypothetical protein